MINWAVGITAYVGKELHIVEMGSQLVKDSFHN